MKRTLPLLYLSIVLLIVSRPGADPGGVALATEPTPPPGLAPRGPHVPGFERLFRGSPPSAQGGRLLIGELGCVSCHTTSEAKRRAIPTKTAPRLDHVGRRLDPHYLQRFIADPGAHDPHTSMPSSLASLSSRERVEVATDLVHFLVSRRSGEFARTPPDEAAVERGEQLFHTIGCVACHAPQDRSIPALDESSVPFPELASKYSWPALRDFLRDPLKFRPSGRMPSLHLSRREAEDLAHYLLRDTKVPGPLRYEVFHGHRRNLDHRERMRRVRTGLASGFDLAELRRSHDVTIRFTGHVRINTAGPHTFHLVADDRARLTIDGQRVIDLNRREKDPKEAEGTVELTAGWHAIELDYFQWRREKSLSLEWVEPGGSRASIPSERLRSTLEEIVPHRPWSVESGRVERGAEHFTAHGCASCHELQGVSQTPLAGPALARLDVGRGCLDPTPARGRPTYAVDRMQWESIAAALESLRAGRTGTPTPASRVESSLAVFDCHACHRRGDRGVISGERRAYFRSEDEQIGEEGSVPPHLDGVGDKLQRDWLHEVLARRGVARPYVLTRMPGYGEQNVGHLVDDFIAVDRKRHELAPAVNPTPEVLEAGRTLVDTRHLQCITCHTFNRRPSAGIQGLDLTALPQRIHRDWFHRFLRHLSALKPETLMPDLWPGGQSLTPDILDGDVHRQIDAIWSYLEQGRRAVDPEGLSRQALELFVGGEAVVYRGKLWEAGFRAIATGHPPEIHNAFDAEEVRLSLLWRGRFLNVSPHWNSQGMGRIRPLGGDVIVFPHGPPFAALDAADTPWPTATGTAGGYRFLGYDLDAQRRPTFRYSWQDGTFEDTFEAIESGDRPFFRRKLVTRGTRPGWMRLWRGASVEAVDGGHVCDGRLRIRVEGAETRSRLSGGEDELLLRLPGPGQTWTIEYRW